MVSFIQSNFTWLRLGRRRPRLRRVRCQGRGHGFSLDPASPNVIAPGKRPFRIIPAFLTRDGEPLTSA